MFALCTGIGSWQDMALAVGQFHIKYRFIKYFIQVCTNISCYLCGANGLLEYLEQKLGIKVGEVTPDGLFSLGTVECLGSCGTAPVIQINNQDFNENLTREKIDRIIEAMKKQK